MRYGAGFAATRMKCLGSLSRLRGKVTVISSTGVALLDTAETGVQPGQMPLRVVDDSCMGPARGRLTAHGAGLETRKSGKPTMRGRMPPVLTTK
jgi:hypothetical protein